MDVQSFNLEHYGNQIDISDTIDQRGGDYSTHDVIHHQQTAGIFLDG